MVFAELREEFLDNIGALELLRGIPVPVNEDPDGRLSVRGIVLDMAKVIGGDAGFLYADQYLKYIRQTAGEQAEPMLVAEAARAADSGSFEEACMMLRTALIIEPSSKAAIYLYGRVCKACYEEAAENAAETGEMTAEGEAYIGSFKAESMDAFEKLTIMYPDYAMGYYFLGYAYLNLGLYLKAKLTWDDFMKLSSAAAGGNDTELTDAQLADIRHEVAGLLLDLEDPVRIEQGCNMIMSGSYQGGREILSDYREGRYENWWPLWYYLGTAESALGHKEEAEACYKRVLQLSPSNLEAMEELAAMYALSGDEVNAAKYRSKIAIVRSNNEQVSADE